MDVHKRSSRSVIFFFVFFFWCLLAVPECVKAERVYVVGIPELFPPHYLLDDNGNPKGFSIDVFNLVAEKAGIQFEYKQFKTWPEIFDAVRKGEVDVIPDIGISEARASFLQFTKPIETFGIGFFVRSSNTSIKKIDDLTGKRIALVAKNVAVKRIQASGKYIPLIFGSNEEALFALLTAEADALCYPIPVTIGLAEKAGIEDKIQQIGNPIQEVRRAIGVSKSNPSLLKVLDDALSELIHYDSFQKIYTKWHGEPVPFWTVKRVTVFSVVGFIILFIVALLWRYRYMRQSNLKLAEMVADQTDALLKSKIQLELATESAMAGIWDWDVSTDVVYFSDIWKALIGYDENELENKFYEWEKRLHPDDRQARLDDVDRFLKNPQEYGGRLDNEFRMMHKDGSYRWIMNRSRAFYNEEGDVVRMMGCHMDITAMKESDTLIRQQLETLKTVLNAFPETLYVMDMDSYEIIFSNRAVNTILGRELKGNYCYEMLHGLEKPCSFCTNEIIKNQTEPYVWYHYNENINAHFYVIDQVIQWVDGRDVRLEIAIDISELKRAQDALVEVNKGLEERVEERTRLLTASNKELEAFAYSVSHDLRAPLRHIKSFVSLLRKYIDDSLDEKSLHYLDMMDTSAKKMDNLIDDLLVFSRLNKEPLQMKSFRLDRMVMEIIEENQLDLQGQRVDWQTELNAPVYGDPRYIQIVLNNLIDNAVKYSAKEASPVIKVVVSEEANVTEIRVIDNGVGFDMQYADKLFGVFQRLHNEDEYSGNGIGLATVQRIIYRHGGEVSAYAEPGKGTEIKVVLPVQD